MGPGRLAGLSLLLLVLPARAQKLEEFSERYPSSLEHSERSVERTLRKAEPGDCEAPDLDRLFPCLLFKLLWSPFEYLAEQPPAGFASRPYSARDRDGYGDTPGASGDRLEVAAQSISESIFAGGIRYRRLTPDRTGHDASFTRYVERDPSAWLTIADYSYTGTFYRSRRAVSAFGYGLKYVGGAYGHAFGPELRLRSELFLGRPWVADLLFDVSAPAGRGLYEFRGGIGPAYGHVQLRFGWRWLVGRDVSIQGPELGLSCWF